MAEQMVSEPVVKDYIVQQIRSVLSGITRCVVERYEQGMIWTVVSYHVDDSTANLVCDVLNATLKGKK